MNIPKIFTDPKYEKYFKWVNVGLGVICCLALAALLYQPTRTSAPRADTPQATNSVSIMVVSNAVSNTVSPNVLTVATNTPSVQNTQTSRAQKVVTIGICTLLALALLAILIANRKRIEGWWTARRARTAAGGGGAPATTSAPTPSVLPVIAKWVFGIFGGLAVAYGLYLIPYAQVWGWLQRLPYGNIPLWGYTVGIPVLILIIAVLIAAMKDGKTGSEKLKKLAELFGAFAKLGLTLAFIAVLAIFIVGPRMFWKGDYSYTPPPAPTGGTQAAPAVPATPVPQSRTITIPVGDLNAPLNQWSEEVRVVPGWSFRWDVVGQSGKMGVLVDGATRVVNDPMKRTDTHATQSLRFISLEGRPMQIAVSYYR